MTHRAAIDSLPNWVLLILMSAWADNHDAPLTEESFRRSWEDGELDAAFWAI